MRELRDRPPPTLPPREQQEEPLDLPPWWVSEQDIPIGIVTAGVFWITALVFLLLSAVVG
jgi:hypothetical protein